MVPRGDASSEGAARDDLELIAGVDRWIAQLVRDCGIRSLSTLADYSEEGLATLLRERATSELTAGRIEREDWIGQARRLSNAHRTGPQETGQQRAGFSVFFDVVRDDAGREVWQTRVYHEESGAEVVLPGVEPGPWAAWILAQALPVTERGAAPPFEEGPPAQLHHVLVRIVESRVVRHGNGPDHAEGLSVEVRLQASGLGELERALGRKTLSSVLLEGR